MTKINQRKSYPCLHMTILDGYKSWVGYFIHSLIYLLLVVICMVFIVLQSSLLVLFEVHKSVLNRLCIYKVDLYSGCALFNQFWLKFIILFDILFRGSLLVRKDSGFNSKLNSIRV